MKKTAIFLVLAMLLSMFSACGASDKKKPDGSKPENNPENNTENEPQNELYAAILKTNELSSFDGKMTVAGKADGQDIQKEIAVSAGYTEDKKFAANFGYDDNSGIYFVGHERYTYSGKPMGGPCRYLQRTDLQYDFATSVLSYILMPLGELGALQLSYPNQLLVYSVGNVADTSEALMALSPKVTEENGETCIEFSCSYLDIVKTLVPNSDKQTDLADIYGFYDGKLTFKIAKEGHLSYVSMEQVRKEDGATILTRTLTIDSVGEKKTMETPRQLSLPGAKYDDYRFCDGMFLYEASPENLIGKGKHPSELEKFHVRVMVAPFRFYGEPISLLTFPTEFLGKPITKIYTDVDDMTLEKLVVPKELSEKWECDNKEAEVFVYWERSGAGNVNSKYKNVYYLGEWDMVDGVPMP